MVVAKALVGLGVGGSVAWGLGGRIVLADGGSAASVRVAEPTVAMAGAMVAAAREVATEAEVAMAGAMADVWRCSPPRADQ